MLFDALAVGVLILAVVMVTGCPPMERSRKDKPGEYTVSSDKLLGRDNSFIISDTLVYKTVVREGMKHTRTDVTDRELAMVRCEWCHECGFLKAWDWENFGSDDWNPAYVGEEWGPIVVRMKDLDNSFLQEEMLALRVYEYLRDETLGVYDEAADDKGATVIELDAPPPGAGGQPAEDGAQPPAAQPEVNPGDAA